MTNFLNESKAAFASYFNMARQNIKITLDDIAENLHYPYSETKEDQLADHPAVKCKDKKPENIDTLLRKHIHHFPFLKIFVLNSRAIKDNITVGPKEISEVLKDLLIILNKERNRASHFILNERKDKDSQKQKASDDRYNNTEIRVAGYLESCLITAIRKAPDVFKFEADELNFIAKNEKGKVTINDFFAIKNKNKGLSDMGRIFLLCLLIEKRYVPRMLDSIKGFYDICNNKDLKKQELEKKRIRQVFSLYHVRLPRKRLNSEMGRITLALDMLNELKKCPEELFDHLSSSNQDKFRIEDSRGEECEMLLKRYSDRFPEFALRYIDMTETFREIRFHVNIGKYRYCFKEDKHCADGIERMRVLQKPINCFSRFEDAENYRKNQLREKYKVNGKSIFCAGDERTPDEASEFPYITDSRSQYLFEGDKVSMSWREEEEMKGIFTMSNSRNIYPLLKIDENKVPAFLPKCFMSIYEIPAMVFHSLLYGKNEGGISETEKLIQDCVMNYRTFFQAIADGRVGKIKCADRKKPQPEEYRCLESEYNILWKDIPDKIKDYLVGRTRPGFEQYASRVIDEMIEKTEYQLECIEKDIETIKGKKNRAGNRSFVEIKTGRLATFLTRDIAMFQPSRTNYQERIKKESDEGYQKPESPVKPDGSDKITGLNYRVVQAAIALYDVRKEGQSYEDFVEMFRNARLIDSDNRHPFLKSVLNQKPLNTIEFYICYLREKLNKLKEIKKNGKYRETYFLHADRVRWETRDNDYYRRLALRYMDKPIDLPRGLFEDSIRKRLSEMAEGREHMENYDEILKKSNVSYMISGYFVKFENDVSQKFYSYQRNYRLMDLLYDDTKYFSLKEFKEHDFKDEIDSHVCNLRVKEKNKKGKIIERDANAEEKEIEQRRLIKNYKDYENNEKALRRMKVQDFLIMAMAKNVIREFVQSDESRNNEDVELFKLKDIKPDAEKGILDMSLPFSVTITLKEGTKIISQNDIKIKNYGEFFSLLYDNRVRTLLPALPEDEIDKTDLEEELDNYDTLRTEIFRSVLKLEKAVMDNNPDIRKKPGIGFRDIIYSLSQNKTEENMEYIISVRNAFAHNSYPGLESIEDHHLPEIVSQIGETFTKEVDSTVKKAYKK